MQDRMTLCVSCLLGVEGLVARELTAQGCAEVRAENGRVLFSGGEAAVARANLWTRCGERVGILVGEYEARTFEELFQGALALPWEDFLGREDAFPVTGSSLSSALHSVPDCQSILKKAIVERLKRRHRVTWFPETGPVHRVRFRLLKDRVSLLLDTSGDPLYKRGYRTESNLAPLRETLAAALVTLARVRPDGTFYDPFCGSGTLLIEAALLAQNRAPGLDRSFAAETWRESDAAVWQQERSRAWDLIRRDADFTATGSDLDPACIELTPANAHLGDARRFAAAGPYGCVVTNPPYGERLLDRSAAQELYRALGPVFPRQKGWSYGILTPEEDFEALFGRRADKRRKLYNGMIPCQFYQYFK